MYFLGLDIGTTGCKSMLFDEKLNIISQDYIEYDLIYSKNGVVEQSPIELWDMAKQTIKSTLHSAEVPKNKISAISISSQGISFVPVDKEGKELCNIISWLDTRAFKQTNEIRNLIGGKYIFNTTGKKIKSSYTLPKIMWIKENEVDIYQNTYKFLMVLDYITYNLTGVMRTDYSMASGTMMFDIINHEWDEKILDICGIDKNKLPDVAEMGTKVGKIKNEVAAELGLNVDTEVILGAQDQKCAAIGAGIAHKVATVSLGTSTAISIISYSPDMDERQSIPCFALDKKRWTYEAVIGTTGAALKWMRNLFDIGYDEMCKLAENSPQGANGLFFYPHFTGAGSPYWKDEAKGSFYGITLSADKSDMIRSLLEGIAFQIKVNIEALEKINSVEIKEVRLFGGGAKQEFWVQLIADVVGLPVNVLYTAEAANVGASMLAAKGIGIESRIDDDRLIKKRYLPNQDAKEEYCKLIKEYLKIQSKTVI